MTISVLLISAGMCLVLASCRCIKYNMTPSGKLKSSAKLSEFDMSELKVDIAESRDYNCLAIPAELFTDTGFVIKSKSRETARRGYRLTKDYKGYQCVLQIRKDGRVVRDTLIANLAPFIKPNTTYVISGLSGGHCPPQCIYFETDAKGRFRNIIVRL